MLHSKSCYFLRLSLLSKLFGSLNFILIFDKKAKPFKFVLIGKNWVYQVIYDIYSFFEQTWTKMKLAVCLSNDLDAKSLWHIFCYAQLKIIRFCSYHIWKITTLLILFCIHSAYVTALSAQGSGVNTHSNILMYCYIHVD